MTYTIHQLTPLLFDQTTGLSETLANLKEVGELSKEKMRTILEKMLKQDTHIFVAIEDNSIIGTVALLVEQKFINKGALAGHIEDVATRKGHEGKGVASALIKEALSYAKERGCYKVMLDCKESLLGFYNKFGFVESDKHMRLDF